MYEVVRAEKMLDKKIEQRVNLKFLCKLGKSASESYETLQSVYGDDCLCRTTVFEWYKRFKEGREDVEDDERPGRPVTSKTDLNIISTSTRAKNPL